MSSDKQRDYEVGPQAPRTPPGQAGNPAVDPADRRTWHPAERSAERACIAAGRAVGRKSPSAKQSLRSSSTDRLGLRATKILLDIIQDSNADAGIFRDRVWAGRRKYHRKACRCVA